jgi:hypothetical protein
VTQQLARLSSAQLAACRASVDVLDQLCSFELLPESDYLDLDWAPMPLVRACELAQVGMSVLTALKRGLDGDTEINPAYRYRADTVWQHPVKAITPDVVAELAKLIGQIKPDVVLAALPSDAQAASSILGLGFARRTPGQVRRW